MSTAAQQLRQLADQHPKVCVVGSINADLTVTVEKLPHGGQTISGSPLRILPGGKSANQAATAGRLGAQTTLIGAVGDDPNGDLLLAALRDAHVDVTNVVRTEHSTGTAMIVVDDSAENFIVISAGANGDVSPELVAHHRQEIESADVLGLCLEIPDEAVLAAAQIAHDAHVPVVFNLSPIRPVPADLLPLVDVLIVNEHELAAIVGQEVAADGFQHGKWHLVAERLRTEFGIKNAVVTLGGEGSVVLSDSGAVQQIPAVAVDVVDTTGCGDSYMGTLLAALAAGRPLEQGAELAAGVSAYAATGAGAQSSYGSAMQVAEFLTKQNH